MVRGATARLDATAPLRGEVLRAGLGRVVEVTREPSGLALVAAAGLGDGA